MSRFLKSAGLTAVLLAVTFGTPAFADGVMTSDAWARARVATAQAGAAYVTLRNDGQTADTLTGASSPVAEVTELHTHIHEGNVMRMRQIQAIPLPAGETVTLKPGGQHLMLIGLKETLSEGMVFPLTLTFAHAPPATITVHVMGMGAMGAKGSEHGEGMKKGDAMKHGHDNPGTMKK